MKKAEVSETMLKNSPEEIKNIFINRIFSLINPKFEDKNEEKIAEFELLDFANKCDLTFSEMILALDMCIKGKLYTEPNAEGYSERIKLFREIDRIKLGEVESAYLYLKTVDRNYEADTEQIKAFLDNKLSEEIAEPSPEEKAKKRKKLVEDIQDEIKKKGHSERAFLIYKDVCKMKEFQPIRSKFIEEYDRQFNKFIAEQSKARLSMYSRKDLEEKRNRHPTVLKALEEKNIKPAELEGIPYQNAKSELVIQFFKTKTQ